MRSLLLLAVKPAANLCIADASVSRRHSVIEKNDSEFVIRDLDSLNGTFVNDVPVKKRKLEHGDRIRIGESQFLFLIDEGEVISKSSQVKLDNGQVLSSSTVQIRFDDALYVMARDLSALMKISTTINAIRGVEELQQRLLDLLFEVVPAQHGAILLTVNEDFDDGSVFALDRIRGKDEAVTVSKTIAQQVLREGVAVLTNDVTSDEELSTQSMVTSRAVSVLCVPLMVMERKLGALYLDTSLKGDNFNRDHLSWLLPFLG
jgi:pSer/pThr/pTyr-binding forkhead associated (FHA) protein